MTDPFNAVAARFTADDADCQRSNGAFFVLANE